MFYHIGITLQTSLDRLSEYFDAVYDVTIAYTDEGKPPQQVREPAPSMGGK